MCSHRVLFVLFQFCLRAVQWATGRGNEQGDFPVTLALRNSGCCYSAGAVLGIPIAVPLNWGEGSTEEWAEACGALHVLLASCWTPGLLPLCPQNRTLLSLPRCPAPCQFVNLKRRYLARLSSGDSQLFDVTEPSCADSLAYGESCCHV